MNERDLKYFNHELNMSYIIDFSEKKQNIFWGGFHLIWNDPEWTKRRNQKRRKDKTQNVQNAEQGKNVEWSKRRNKKRRKIKKRRKNQTLLN